MSFISREEHQNASYVQTAADCSLELKSESHFCDSNESGLKDRERYLDRKGKVPLILAICALMITCINKHGTPGHSHVHNVQVNRYVFRI